jgi:hypothetical protein
MNVGLPLAYCFLTAIAIAANASDIYHPGWIDFNTN